MPGSDGLPFEVPPGTEVVLQRGEWKDSTGPLRLRVECVRWDLLGFYNGADVWVEGHRLDERRLPLEPVRVLVSTHALRRSLL